MALIHDATLKPEKIDLLEAWVPGRAWSGGVAGLSELGAYRFDDPAGEVGIESFLLGTADGTVLHAPLTYRASPLPGAEAYLVGTTEHSVLGRRWVYDGCGDPVWAAALATAVLTGGSEAAELVDVGDGRLEPQEPSASVSGSGGPEAEVPAIRRVTCHDEGATTVVRAGALEIVVARVVGAEIAAPHTLTGRWAAGGPAVLAGVRPVT